MNILVLEADDRDDPTEAQRPHCNRRLPVRYHTGKFISSDPPCTHAPENTVADTNEHNADIMHIPSPKLPPAEHDNTAEEDSNEPPPIKFSSSDKVDKADQTIHQIRQYLTSWHAPLHLTGDALICFISRTHHFCIAGGRIWQRQGSGHDQLYVTHSHHYSLVHNTHDKLRHKGFYATCRTLLDCFWWLALETDVKWYVKTCHQCQIRQTRQVRIPPAVDTPAPLFCKVYIDTMFMLHAGGYRYIAQARCLLTAWPEWRALRVETRCTIGAFIFKEILCRWGAVQEIVTDNGMAYIAALNWLVHQ